MAARQMEWGRRKRAEIMAALGNVCAGFGRKCRNTKHLELDCIKPVGNMHAKWGYDTRVRFYIKQFKAGNLQILCNKCHERKSTKEQRDQGNMELDLDNEPF